MSPANDNHNPDEMEAELKRLRLVSSTALESQNEAIDHVTQLEEQLRQLEHKPEHQPAAEPHTTEILPMATYWNNFCLRLGNVVAIIFVALVVIALYKAYGSIVSDTTTVVVARAGLTPAPSTEEPKKPTPEVTSKEPSKGGDLQVVKTEILGAIKDQGVAMTKQIKNVDEKVDAAISDVRVIKGDLEKAKTDIQDLKKTPRMVPMPVPPSAPVTPAPKAPTSALPAPSKTGQADDPIPTEWDIMSVKDQIKWLADYCQWDNFDLTSTTKARGGMKMSINFARSTADSCDPQALTQRSAENETGTDAQAETPAAQQAQFRPGQQQAPNCGPNKVWSVEFRICRDRNMRVAPPTPARTNALGNCPTHIETQLIRRGGKIVEQQRCAPPPRLQG